MLRRLATAAERALRLDPLRVLAHGRVMTCSIRLSRTIIS
jgi:hypothetical protein